MESENSYFQKKLDMVEYQLKGRGITDKRVLDAFLKVNRHNFVLDEYREFAYTDRPLPIGYGQTISQPYMVAAMTELLELDEDDILFEIGTGSGYQAAIASQLCKKVYTVEIIPELAEFAKRNLEKENIQNVEVFVGDGLDILKEIGMVDKIIITAASPPPNKKYFTYLKNRGLLVLPEGDLYSQTLVKYKKDDDSIKKEQFFMCSFVPLKGKFGITK